MSDTNSRQVPMGVDHDEFDDDEVIEEVPTQLMGETMSDGKIPVDGDTMSDNDRLRAHDGRQG